MHLTRWPFWWPRQCAGTVPRTSTDAPCSALQLKPLDTAIGQIYTSKQKNTIKRQNKHRDLHGTSQTKKTNVHIVFCPILYFPRANFAPKIGGHTSSTQEANYQEYHLNSSAMIYQQLTLGLEIGRLIWGQSSLKVSYIRLLYYFKRCDKLRDFGPPTRAPYLVAKTAFAS